MKAKQLIIGFFLFLVFTALPLNAQEQKFQVFSAQVISSEDSSPVSFAHVILKDEKKGLMCNELGNFSCKALVNDTIIITAIGYETRRLPLDSFNIDINNGKLKLKPLTYSIDEVVIVPYKNYKEFREAFIAMEIPEKPFINLNIPNIKPDAGANLKDGPPMISVGSPISALYNAFSKEGKELAEYSELMDKKAIEKKVQKKYNKNIVSFVTGIMDERKVFDFMEFCSLSDEFIINSNDYQIYLAINNCFKEFQKLI